MVLQIDPDQVDRVGPLPVDPLARPRVAAKGQDEQRTLAFECRDEGGAVGGVDLDDVRQGEGGTAPARRARRHQDRGRQGHHGQGTGADPSERSPARAASSRSRSVRCGHGLVAPLSGEPLAPEADGLGACASIVVFADG